MLGAAHYRAGNFQEAIRWLDESIRIGPERIQQSLFLAMAHHELGHADDSRRWLASAVSSIEYLNPVGGNPPYLKDWLEIQVLRREAEELLETKSQ